MAKHKILFRLIKGFSFGALIGLLTGVVLYLLTAAVQAIVSTSSGGALPITPGEVFALFFAIGMGAGTFHEYSDWLESQGEEDQSQNKQ